MTDTFDRDNGPSRSEIMEEELFEQHNYEKKTDGICPLHALGEDCPFGCDEEQ